MKISDFFRGTTAIDVKGPGVLTSFEIFGVTINITETIVLGWVLIAVLACVFGFMTHKMEKVPTKKRQIIAEWIVNTFHNLLDDTMGKEFRKFTPYVATIFIFSICGSLLSLLGLRPMTGDFNVTFSWAMVTFIMIQYTKVKTNGFFGYIKDFFAPFPVMLPLNIISEVSTPVSMGFRHFGNVAGGMIISSLIYFALTGVSSAIGLAVPVFTIGIPAVLSVYFDLFSGFMQAFIFIMLTMIYISSGAEKDD